MITIDDIEIHNQVFKAINEIVPVWRNRTELNEPNLQDGQVNYIQYIESLFSLLGGVLQTQSEMQGIVEKIKSIHEDRKMQLLQLTGYNQRIEKEIDEWLIAARSGVANFFRLLKKSETDLQKYFGRVIKKKILMKQLVSSIDQVLPPKRPHIKASSGARKKNQPKYFIAELGNRRATDIEQKLTDHIQKCIANEIKDSNDLIFVLTNEGPQKAAELFLGLHLESSRHYVQKLVREAKKRNSSFATKRKHG